MPQVLDSLEASSDTVLYALDETSVSTEPVNRYSWSEVGHPPVLEHNGSHEGVHLIGATEVLKNFDTVVDAYPGDRSITGAEIQTFLERLLEINPGKKITILWDNAKIHLNERIQRFWEEHREHLSFINLPRYCPDMNPQENVWNRLKALLYKPSARENIFELVQDIYEIYNELNSNIFQVRSLASARSFLV